MPAVTPTKGESQPKYDWKRARLPDAAEAAPGGDAHVEEEEAERAAEDALRKGRDLVPPAFAGEVSHHQAAEQEEDRAVEQALDSEARKRAAFLAGGWFAQAQAEEPGHDGGTLHEGQRRDHVAVVGDVDLGEEIAGRHEGHRAHRAVGGPDGGALCKPSRGRSTRNTTTAVRQDITT